MLLLGVTRNNVQGSQDMGQEEGFSFPKILGVLRPPNSQMFGQQFTCTNLFNQLLTKLRKEKAGRTSKRQKSFELSQLFIRSSVNNETFCLLPLTFLKIVVFFAY